MPIPFFRLALSLLLVAAATLPSQAQSTTPPAATVPVYVFWGDGCPHCAAQKPFLAELEATYPQVRVQSFEVWYRPENRELFRQMAARAGFEPGGVPATLIGDRVWVGFHESMKREMELAVIQCIRTPCVDRGRGIVAVPSAALRPTAPQPPAPPAPVVLRRDTAEAATAGSGTLEIATQATRPSLEMADDPPRPHPEAPLGDTTPAVLPPGGIADGGEASALHLPLIGAVSLGSRSLPVSTALIAFVDGFNPCSLWVLSILLALVIHTGSRRRIALVGSTFLLVTAAVYGLFIAGLFKVFTVVDFLGTIQGVVALFALAFAVVNIKDYFWYRQGLSFGISDKHKPGIYQRIRNLASPGKTTAALLGSTVVMALGIALIELPCTAGFPVLWTSIVASHGVSTAEFGMLLGLYMTVYLLDELVVFGTAVYTLRMSRMQEKHGRVLKLAGGMVMLTLALVLLLDPGRMNSVGGSLQVFAAAFGATLVVLLVHRRLLPALGWSIGSERIAAKKGSGAGKEDGGALGRPESPHSHPFSRAMRAASTRLAAPSLAIASER
jgi:thiol-disulfide isomerase/thioredoxin